MNQPARKDRRERVRYEVGHSIILWYADWERFSDDHCWIASEDDDSRVIMSHEVFRDATIERMVQVLKQDR